jgi:predicted dehydrogenase
VATVALRRGIPALIEKPLATTKADAEEICELADRHGTFVSVAYRSRYWPAVPLLRHLIETNYLGPIRRFSYTFGTRSTWAAASNFALSRQMAGGGILIDAHVIDKILYWFGEPASFEFWDDSHGGVEGTCRARLTYAHAEGGFEGEVLLSRTMELEKRIVIETDRYVCELAEAPSADVRLREKARPDLTFRVSGRDVPAASDRTDFQLQVEEFARNVRNRGAITVDGRFGARSVRIIEEMYRQRRQLPEPWLLPSTAMERGQVSTP